MLVRRARDGSARRGAGSTWDAEREYFRTLSTLLPASPNILFGIREQVQPAGERTRCADLSEVVAPRQSDCRRREDLEWLLTCLRVAAAFFEVLAVGCRAIADTDGVGLDMCPEKLRELEALCCRASEQDFSDPLGGDVGTWLPAVAELRGQFPWT